MGVTGRGECGEVGGDGDVGIDLWVPIRYKSERKKVDL